MLRQDLISRYNLSSKLSAAATKAVQEPTPDVTPATQNTSSTAWASTKSERAALLARRRDEMILNARRKMEEKDRNRDIKGKEAVR